MLTPDLQILREKINQLDLTILSKLTERASLLQAILASKVDSVADDDAIKIFDPNREAAHIRELLQHNASILPDEAIIEIFETIIAVCRNYQFTQITHAKPFLVSIQGAEGSYSQRALLQYAAQKNLKEMRIRFAKTSQQVLADITSGTSDYGIVALNNAQGGLVSETLDALSVNRYLIMDSIVLRVEHALHTKENISPDEVKQIYSHPQALKQCQYFLATHFPQATQHPWIDTAQAAADLASGVLPETAAVIAHADCGCQHHLVPLAKQIQDLGADNETLFLLITPSKRKD